ncbi:glycosyl-4,4'-diaponeurosporenoate acyltransferase [Metabacillus iocasae]|uniref:Glycosyl-4,4'-diaponeurosporenoate acyltransferase n=1 Tax=Priestia iocasae TaxID=2291674 RepID=A0ABS2QRF0_9BACI|nr:glycosyl-4,4'-diaponeurosporenoate acyltransferase [Metabacillus iocasae]MBM7702028.1 glycosyl-4,4'-diaponeurosporenoate acyltransferase [Metabacillus iocasae]
MIEFTPIVVTIINIFSWLVIHLGISYLCVLIPIDFFKQESWIYKEKKWEERGRLYERLQVKKWKDKLPEGGGIYKRGFEKRTLKRYANAYLSTFLFETKRAELTHWLSIPPSLFFFLWNPPVVGIIMIVYAVTFNLPFIMVQRYNRIRLTKLIQKKGSIDDTAISSTYIELDQ